MADPGPRQNFNQLMTAISFKAGRFLVIELYYKGKNRTGKHTIVSTSFGETSTEKTMPFVAGGSRSKKPDSLNVKTDLFLTSQSWTQHTGPTTDTETTEDAFDEYREIWFINVGVAEKDQDADQKHVDFELKLTGINSGPPGSSDSKGYFAWLPQATEFGVPPPPTPADAISVISIDTLIGPYSGVWIEYVNSDVFNQQIIPGWRSLNASRGLPLPEVQAGPFGGWKNEAEQIASINAINLGSEVDHQIANTPVDPNEVYFPVTYDFGASPDNGKPQEIEYEVKAGYYTGRFNFPYDSEKKKLFPDAQDDTTADDAASRMAKVTITKTKPSDDTTMTIRLSKDNKVSIDY